MRCEFYVIIKNCYCSGKQHLDLSTTSLMNSTQRNLVKKTKNKCVKISGGHKTDKNKKTRKKKNEWQEDRNKQIKTEFEKEE